MIPSSRERIDTAQPIISAGHSLFNADAGSALEAVQNVGTSFAVLLVVEAPGLYREIMWPQWSAPWWLLSIVVIPPLVWWLVWQPRGALRFSATRGLSALPAGRRTVALWGGALIRGTALLSLIIALAGPRWPDERTRITTEGIALMMVVDVSGSMAEPDFDWQGERISRLDAVKKVFRLFVEGGDAEGQVFDGRFEDLVGLVTFASRPDCPCPLTLSHAVLLRLLDTELPRQIPGESQTNISDAVALALDRLEAAHADQRKVLILLSDGEHNETKPRSGWSLAQSAQLARALGQPIYTIDAGGVGPTNSENIAVSRAKAVQDMKMLADTTGGQYFRAEDTKALLGVCREIDRLERQPIQSYQYRRYHEGFAWFATTAFLLFIGVAVLELSVWRRVP
jgi:Ca-activated chloride channel family protein